MGKKKHGGGHSAENENSSPEPAVLDDATITANVVRAVSEVRASFNSGKPKSLGWRRHQLKAFLKMLREGRDQLCEALETDLHKSKEEGYFFEINLIEQECQHCLDHLEEWAAPESVATNLLNVPGHSYIYKDPLGVVLIIGAWNYPIQLTLSPLVGAIASGNCAVVKVPSPIYSAASSRTMSELAKKYLDQSCIRFIEGDRTATQAVLSQRFDHICFTGGLFVGKLVAEAAAKHLTPTTLELGGKSPVIVDGTADLAVAARRVVWGAMTNAGQTCIRPDYIMVESKVADRFIEECRLSLKAFYGANPQQSDFFGRLINARAFDRVEGLIKDAHAGAGRVVVGGQLCRDEKYVAPTLVDYGENREAFLGSELMKAEIFGPILPILRWSTLDDALDIIKSNEKPLMMHCFTTNWDVSERVLTETSSGSAIVNDTMMNMSNANLPFGGVGYSGHGCYHGKYTFDLFTHKKAVLQKYFVGDLPQRYPPYAGASKLAILNTVQYPYSRNQLRAFKAIVAMLVVVTLRRLGVTRLLRRLLLGVLIKGSGLLMG